MVQRIPDLPGILVPADNVIGLRRHVARLCRLEGDRFPGSQPVSFAKKDLDRLEREDYWVCEKSDGVRVLLLIVSNPDPNHQDIYLINRHNEYRMQTNLFFPHFDDPRIALRNTLLDGELLVDTDPNTGVETLRLLLFDCLVVDDQNVMEKNLQSRFGRLKACFFAPHDKMLREYPNMKINRPYDIQIKQMELSYSVEMVFREVIPRLQHGNDGLVFTCVSSGYVCGTDPRLLKWKPASENSIDFLLELRFPPVRFRTDQPDFTAKPMFVLLQWLGGDKHEFFDTMQVDDDEWESMKASQVQFDDRVVEVCWNPIKQCWKLMRFRDDKPNGNHKNTIENILSTILDGVEKDDLISCAPAIRTAWKARDAARVGRPPIQPIPINGRPIPHQPPNRPPPLQPQLSNTGQGLPPSVLPPPPNQSFESMVAKVTGPLVVHGFIR